MKLINISKKNTFRVATLSAAVALVSACSDPSNPDGGTSLTSTSVSGVVIDGYLARATVYADLNNNGRLDSGEPSAITDSDGYYSTAMDGTDYCASSDTEKHCLQLTGSVPESVILRTRGGFDLFTGERFIGQLSAVVAPDVGGGIPNQNITPLSSLGSSAASLLGLTEGQVNNDFIMNSTFDAEAANLAFKLHKVAVIYADLFESVYKSSGEDGDSYFGNNASFPDSASSFVYDAFATHLVGGAEINSATLANVFDTVDARIVETFNDIEGETDISSRTGSSRAATIANANSVLGLINSAMPSGIMTADQIRARMIGVEMVVAKMIDDDSESSAVQDAINEAANTASDLYNALGDGTNVDFSELLSINYSSLNPNSFDSVSVTGGISFSDLKDKELYVEYEGDEGESGSALLLFDGESAESTSGSLKFCVKYDDGDSLSTEIYETDGTLIQVGGWDKLDDRRVIINLLGGLDFTLISRGVTDTNRNLFSMSFAGETETWDTDSTLDDISTNSNEMETNQNCADRLNELGS